LNISFDLIVTSHGSDTNSNGQQCDNQVWYINEDKLSSVEWIISQLDNRDWIKGKITCPWNCGARLGSYDFITGSRCICSQYILPSVHLVKSRVDLS